MGVVWDIVSGGGKCCVERVEQGSLAEGLEQTFHGAGLEQARPDTGVFVGGDEYDRYLLPPPPEFSLKIGSRHPRHGRV
jgi:hypothetical protein